VSSAAPGRAVALAAALLVTLLWSTSWVLIKVGLDDLELPPILFAGLRYAFAATILLVIALPGLRRSLGRDFDRSTLSRVALLGLLLYALTQGAQFAALVHLPAVAVSLALSATPVIVAVAGLHGHERPAPAQIAGAFAVVAGAALYFGPLNLGPPATLGLTIVLIAVLANAASTIVGRQLARDALPQVGGILGLTALSMAVGAVILVGAGLLLERLPPLSAGAWLIIGWLAIVNTAFAFTLWNHTLRTLTAVESSVMNNMMLIQIAVLAWLFLGEQLDGRQLVGLSIALAGVLVVQLAGVIRDRRRARAEGAGRTESGTVESAQ
jgi:drug/metabolite transporter (DMT)-like permease